MSVLPAMDKTRIYAAVAVFATLFVVAAAQDTCEKAEKCDQAACEALGPENCHCSGNETSIPVADRPMVKHNNNKTKQNLI